jgi:putative hydrolase of the HAD superfamily
MQNRIRTVIFDIDGILDHTPRFSDRYSKEFGIPLESMTSFFKGPFTECVLGKSDLKVELTKVMRSWKWEKSVDQLLAYWINVELHPDKRILNVISALKSKGVHVYGATNQEKYRMAYLRSLLDLDKHFEKIFASCELGLSKYDEVFYRTVLKEIHARADETLFWDDDEKKIGAARKVGIIAHVFNGYDSLIQQLAEYSLIFNL